MIQQQLSQVAGVGQITLGGAPLPSVRIELEPDKLTVTASAWKTCGLRYPRPAQTRQGDIDQGDQRFEVTSNDQAVVAADYKDLIVAYRNGSPVLLRDIAEVTDANENIRNVGLYNDQPAVGVIVYPIPGANIVETDAQIRKGSAVGRGATLPHGVHVNIAMDRSQSVSAAVGDTERTLTIAVMLVIGVVFVFLQSVRSTWIPAVALPLSIIGTFGPMYLLGYNVDNLSLMALTIGTGFVVDAAVSRAREHCAPSRLGPQSTGSGVARQRRGRLHSDLDEPVPDRGVHSDIADARHCRSRVSRVRGDAVDRHPVLNGDLAHHYALHVRPRPQTARGVAFQGALGRLDGESVRSVRNAYSRGLHVVLDRTLPVGLVLIGLIVGNVYLFKLLPSTFFPEQDTGIVIGQIIADQAISFPAMSEKLAQLQRIVQTDAWVASVLGLAVSGSSGRSGDKGNVYIRLKPLAERAFRRSGSSSVCAPS